MCIEYLSQLPEEEMKRLTDLIYDDNCHLSRFALNKNAKTTNEITKLFAENVRKNIDRFHFVNHIDQWCIDNCDPNKVRELDGVNTEVCEQLFHKVNSHLNCKSMNESKYFLFWLYNLDLHNLDIEDLTCASDPRTEYRWQKIMINEVDLTDLKKMNINEDKTNEEDVTKMFENVKIREDTFMCSDCGGAFKSEGYLQLHRERKHGDVIKPFMCSECNKILQSKRNLEEHIRKVHRTCKICKECFKSENELMIHKKTHTVCPECNVDMMTKYKLDRHLKTH